MTASTITVTAPDSAQIDAYLARPSSDHKRGGVIVIHHLPGFDRATKEITRRFAELGYDAICPNLYSRQAPGAAPDDAAALVRAQGGKPDEELVIDVTGAATYLRSLPGSNGKVGVIGYCSGGRQAVLAACTTDVDAAVDCYGAFVTGTPPQGWVLNVTNLVDQLPNLQCPLLGLFGDDDKTPSPEHVDELSRVLTEHGKKFELHSYPNAGHAFFAVDRPSYRVEAANDGWDKVETFFGKQLATTGGNTDVHL